MLQEFKPEMLSITRTVVQGVNIKYCCRNAYFTKKSGIKLVFDKVKKPKDDEILIKSPDENQRHSLLNLEEIDIASLKKKDQVEEEPREDTVFVGKQYELEVVAMLSKFGMDLKHTGKTADHGVDFRGTWNLPENNSFLVLGQCKKENKKIQPGYMREFEGVLVRNTPNTIGVFASYSGYTTSALLLATNSIYPLLCCHIQDNKLLAFRMNLALQKMVPQLSPGRVRDSKEVKHLVYTTKAENIVTINVD